MHDLHLHARVAREREQLAGEPDPLLDVRDVQQRDLARGERGDQHQLVAELAGERDRLLGEPQRRVALAGEVQDLGEPGEQVDAQLLRRAGGERLAQQLDQLEVDDPGLVVAAAVADRRARELLRRAAAGEAGRLGERGARRRVAAARAGVAEREQELGAAGWVVAQRVGLERALELQRLVLPGERLGGALGASRA